MYQILAAPIAVVAVFAVGAFFWPGFIDPASLLLTLGGSAFVTWVSYTNDQLLGLFLDLQGLLTGTQTPLRSHSEELARLGRLYRLDGLKGLEIQERRVADPFLKTGIGMLVDLHKTETIRARLERELAGVISRNESSRQILLTLGRVLPAFGLIGTLIGMILLLRNVAGQDDQALTTALSLAVLTTLYGAVLANVVVTPFAARLHAAATENERKMELTLEWVTAIARGEGAAPVAGKSSGSFHFAEAQALRNHDWAPLAYMQHR